MTVSNKQASGESSTSPQQQAAVIVERMSTLRQEGRLEEALALGEDVRRRFEPAAEPAVGVELSRALLHTTACLAQKGRHPEALALVEEVLQRWSEDPGGEALGLLAEALLTQGLVLARQGRFGEAIASFSKCFRRIEGSSEQALRERAVQALLCTACLLLAMSQKDDALALVGKARRKFAGETGVTLVNALHSLVDQPLLLEDLGREFLVVFDAVFGELAEPTAASRQDFARAHAGVGLALLSLARQRIENTPDKAHQLLEQARDKALTAARLEPDNAAYLGRAGYLCFLTDQRDQALELTRGALQRGPRDPQPWMLSAGLPQDDAFVALVRSL